MPKTADPLAAKLVAASLDFHRLRHWLELEQDTAFFIRLPDEPHPIVAIVMGQGGEEFGLALFRGARAVEVVRRLMSSENGESFAIAEDVVQLAVTLDPIEAIPLARRAVLIEAGFNARRGTLAPLFFAATHNGARHLNRTEMRVMTVALRAVVKGRAQGPLESGRVEEDTDLFTLRVVEMKGGPPRIERGREPLPPLSEVDMCA